MKDKIVEYFIQEEHIRQNQGIELIASENYPSMDVMQAQGSVFTAKYAEGYPNRRYYGGCENIDSVEELAINRAKKLFNASVVNVQPHSGSQANFAAYHAIMDYGDTLLSLELSDGGHLTHGSPVSFSSKLYNVVHYSLGADGRLDYKNIEESLDKYNPKVFLAGYSAYPYEIDFKKLREIVDQHNKHSDVKCIYMVDMAHIAGIVAAGLCQNPVEYADIVTTTTHKTLRGPRGGMILSKHEFLEKPINFSVFPYSQGGPLEHVIAAKAICFGEALKPEFKIYISNLLENTKACADRLESHGVKVSGTDNHLFLINIIDTFGITGAEAQKRLEDCDITANKQTIPGDKLPPMKTSGLRVGFAAATSRGCTKDNANEIADIIFEALSDMSIESKFFANRVHKITKNWNDIAKLDY